ncbi:MAG: hypothetical protein HC888_03205 [Candidatus Competibacteraceae bacterium]|nr:hypothetical protein [Candidatus Competibacteraceae bacterium]
MDLIVDLGLADNRKQALKWASVQMGIATEGYDPRIAEANNRIRKAAARMAAWVEHQKFSYELFAEHFRHARENLQSDWENSFLSKIRKATFGC